MKNFLKEHKKIMNKSNNLSRNNLSKKIKNIKLITEYSQKTRNYNSKLNLKCVDFYKYDFNNILERRNKSGKAKIKKLEQNYSSFYSKTTNYLDSDFFAPNFNSPNKTNTNQLYNRIFSAKTNYSENRAKSTKSKFSKSSKFDISFNKEYKGFLNFDIYDSNNLFNKNNYNNFLKKKKKASLSHFLENSKIIRKRKIIQYYLEDRYRNEKEIIEEKYNRINKINNSNSRNLYLIKQYGLLFDKYFEKLQVSKIKEKQENEIYKEKKIQLNIEIGKIMNRINNVKEKLFKLISIKEFLIFIKNQAVDKSKISNQTNIILLKNELDQNINSSYDEAMAKYNKNKINISKSMIQNMQKNIILNKSFQRRNSQQCKIHYDSKSKNKSFLRKQTETNIKSNNNINSKKKSLILPEKININKIFENIQNINDFKDVFNKFENVLLKNLNRLTDKKNELLILKKNLEYPESNKDDNILISSKNEILNYEKKRHKMLTNKLNSIKYKFSEKENINKSLYKKLFNILSGINRKVSIKKKFELSKIFQNLKIDTKDFVKKMHMSKNLYMIKSIESITLFYKEFLKRFLDKEENREIYKLVYKKFRKEKEVINFQIMREKLNNKKIEKENLILKESNKIRIIYPKKYIIKLNMKRKKNKTNIRIKNENNNSFEQLITYY